MDVADFLQEIPTPDGRRFCSGRSGADGASPPVGTEALVAAWLESDMFKAMLAEMDSTELSAKSLTWPAVYTERFPSSNWYTFVLCLEREAKLLWRNKPYLFGRLNQTVLIAIISGTVFVNLATDDTNSMRGILFFSALFVELTSVSMIPVIFEQRDVFYKQAKSLFYPTWIYVLAQAVVMYPLMILETFISSLIVYWSVGMSSDDHGSRFFTYMIVMWVFSLVMLQLFRLTSSILPSAVVAQPVGGMVLIMTVLFGGFIIPKSGVPPGWEWFYWLDPLAHALKAVTVNEFLSPDYDYQICADASCNEMPVPPPPIVIDFSEELAEEAKADKVHAEIPYEPATFAFKDISYTVTLPTGENL
eukprot:gene47559-biopygen38386